MVKFQFCSFWFTLGPLTCHQLNLVAKWNMYPTKTNISNRKYIFKMVVLVFDGVSLRLLRIIRQGGPHQIGSQDSRIYFWSSLPTFIFSSVVSEVGLHPLQSANKGWQPTMTIPGEKCEKWWANEQQVWGGWAPTRWLYCWTCAFHLRFCLIFSLSHRS